MLRESYKDGVYQDTQGVVDTGRDYPTLGRYFEKPIYPKNYLDEAKKIFNKEERGDLDRRFDNPLKPEVILFADKSQEALNCFTLLLLNDIGMKVFPTDEYISRPSVGFIITDTLYEGEDQVKKFVQWHSRARKRIDQAIGKVVNEYPNKLSKDPVQESMSRKIRLIKIDWAIKEMAAIQNAS